jgi:Arc/MetJ family transcription regulator
MYKQCILIHMRTTLNIGDTLIAEAARLTGVTEKTALVRMGLEALIARESARRLADLGGTEKNLDLPPRRRTARAA